MKTNRKLNIGSPHYFDMMGQDGNKFHGKYEGTRSNKAVIKYVTKDGHFISSMSREDIERLK